MNKQPAYEASHPVAVALGGMVRALRSGADLLEALAEQARRVGVAPLVFHGGRFFTELAG